jgi:preprotein translocase subunit Sss1
MIDVMSALLDNVISFLSSDVGLWLVGAVIFGFIIRLLIQCISALLR